VSILNVSCHLSASFENMNFLKSKVSEASQDDGTRIASPFRRLDTFNDE
jgi:hypothetical protein